MASISTTTLNKPDAPTFGQRIGGAVDYVVSYFFTTTKAAQAKAQETKDTIYAIPERVTDATKSVIHSGASQVAHLAKTTHEISVGTSMDDFDAYLKGDKKPALTRLAHAIADFFATFYDKHFSSNGKIARNILANSDKDVKSFYSVHYKTFNKLTESDPLREAVLLARFLGADHNAVRNKLSALIEELSTKVVAEVKTSKPSKHVTFNDTVDVQTFNGDKPANTVKKAKTDEETVKPKKMRRRRRAANKPRKASTVVTDGPARRTRSRSVAC